MGQHHLEPPTDPDVDHQQRLVINGHDLVLSARAAYRHLDCTTCGLQDLVFWRGLDGEYLCVPDEHRGLDPWWLGAVPMRWVTPAEALRPVLEHVGVPADLVTAETTLAALQPEYPPDRLWAVLTRLANG